MKTKHNLDPFEHWTQDDGEIDTLSIIAIIAGFVALVAFLFWNTMVVDTLIAVIEMV